MNQYSMLWGTSDTGEYRRLWYSKKLGDFLGSIGATDPTRAADTAQNILRSFGNYPDYTEQPIDDKPVAVHYAPMHLYKLPEFPGNLKPFCAWSVTGAENRPGGRNSTYSHTVIFPYEMMLGSEKSVNYMDILFGTKCLSWQEIKAFREKTKTPAFDAAPEKVRIEFSDLKAAVYAAALLIEAKGEKNLIIRLEENCSFNRRAFTLLSQIYALLPPKLATETGFATYHPMEDIAGISSKNSICVFVLPASAAIEKCADSKTTILDFADENLSISLQQSALTESLVQWSKLSTDKRCAAYEKLFEDAPAYLESSLFVQRSKEFFDSIRGFEAWLSASGDGTIQSLEDIRALFSEHAEWTRIPWYKEQFRQRIPVLLPKNIKYSTLLDTAVSQYHLAQSDAEKKEAGELYRIGSQFGEIDILGLCASVSKRQDELTEARFLPKIQEAEERYSLLEKKSEEDLLSQKEEFEELVQTTKKNYEDKLATSEDRHVEEIAQLKDAAEKEKVAACAVAEERLKKAERVFKQQKADIARERESRKQVEGELLSERESHRKTKERLSDVRSERDHLSRDLEDAEDQIDNLGSWPQFLTKMPWWLSLIIALLIGAILVGAIWGITIFVGKGEEEIVATEAVSTTQMPTETTMDTTIETTEAVPETTELQPDPTFVYNDWQNEETARQLRLAVPDIITVQTDEAVQLLCPTELEGYTVQALLSTDEIIFMSEEGEEQTFSEENYALLLLKTENAEDIDLTTLHEPVLAMQKGNQILLSYGNDQMMNAAICTIQTITAVPVDNPSEEVADEYAEVPDSTEVSDVEGESVYEDNETDITEEPKDVASEPFRMLWIFEGGNVIDLGTAIASIMETDDWWKTVSEWSTDSTDLQALNLSRTPILAISASENRYYLYDFSDNLQEAQKFFDDNEDCRIEQLGDFVLAEESVVPQGYY